MSLFTDAEITTLGLTDYSDIELEALEDDIYQITKNDFGLSQVIISGIASNVITLYDEETHNISIGDNIRIYLDSIPDYNMVLTVTATTDTTVTVSEDIPDYGSEDDETATGIMVKIRYPSGLKVLASRYLKAKLSEGVSSERVGRYAVTYNKAKFDQDIRSKYGKYYKRKE
jgi:hypothetical protein